MVNPLSRVAMGNTVQNNPIISAKTYDLDRGSNLTSQEEGWITALIKGEREVVEGTTVNKKITLEEAAKRIKNNY
ncbi:MAG: hypothetical protein M0Q14_10585 [Tissierellaceae bacterium]|nr:hypothetical protein [Tissierellaceae bacterium]